LQAHQFQKQRQRKHARINPVYRWVLLVSLSLMATPLVRAAGSLSISVSTGNPTVTATSTDSTLATVNVQTSWDMPGFKNVNLTTCTYMTAGLTSPGAPTIPISNVRVVQGASTRTMVSQPSCNNAAALKIGTTFITDNNSADPLTRSKNGSQTNTMQLQVVNTGALLPGTYTGTVVVSALVY
jgi:hypothetical protein